MGVTVVDRRPAVRDVVARVLETEGGCSVIARLADAAELRTLQDPYDLLAVGDADEPDGGWSTFAVPIHRLRDSTRIGAAFPWMATTSTTPGPPHGTRLTVREREVLGGIADGARADDIAGRMKITTKSVDNHKQRIFAKLGVQSQAQALLVAREAGELPVGRGGHHDGELVVLVADPSPLLAEVLAVALGAAPEIQVAVAASLGELTAECARLDPDVVLTATHYPDGDALPVLTEVLGRGRRVLLMAEADESEAVTALLFAGASGCLLWSDAGPKRVVAAVRDVAAGGAALHPAAAAAVLAQWRATRSGDEIAPEPTDGQRVPALSPRETDVLHALARGLPTKLIGRELSVSPKTVEAHIARLLAKLGARSRIQAVSAARARGLL